MKFQIIYWLVYLHPGWWSVFALYHEVQSVYLPRHTCVYMHGMGRAALNQAGKVMLSCQVLALWKLASTCW